MKNGKVAELDSLPGEGR